MAEDEPIRRLFEPIPEFEWDAQKAASNRRKHGIDFDEALEVFYGASLLRRSDRKMEERWIAIGESEVASLPWCSRGEGRQSGSSQHVARGSMKNERTIRRKWGDRRRGKTDWPAVDALTDKDIEEAVRNDPDAAPLDINWSEAVLVIPPRKKAISIRVDEDVLDYFKHEGAGYQRRMNAVLRSYVEQKRKTPVRKRKRA